MALQKKYLTKEEALQKAKQYCAYQERSHHDVVQKLWDLGVRKAEHDEIISALIEEDYLNEERFAVQYAGGKFRMKDWGRKKIYYGLRTAVDQQPYSNRSSNSSFPFQSFT
jgi:regulatory protein